MSTIFSLRERQHKSFLFFIIILLLHASYVFAEEDKRTPFEKYQGAYTGAWLMCTLNQKLAFRIKEAHARGVQVEPELEEKVDIPACKKKGLADMKKEYNNILPLVKNEAGKKALTEHYVAAIMHVKSTHDYPKETEENFTDRMNEANRKTTELWVRFEITQP